MSAINVFELFAKLSLDSSGFEQDLEKSGSKMSSFGGAVKSGLATVAKVGAAAVGAASAAATAFAKSSVEAGMEFDSSMAQVAATMGVTVDEIEELRNFALKMGSDTAFSASQAADALNYMALAGYDAEQAMTALPNVLNLAAAGGIDLATASDMVTDAQSALGLSMEESAELVNMMAQASSKSNTSVAQLGDAILTVGGTAKNLAGGTVELNTVLGILADNGIKGAEGGTALRNMLTSLTAPTDKASKLLDSMGVSVFDASGNIRSLNDIFLDLGTAMDSMAQEERMNVISTIFNARDMKSAEALLANVGDRYEELSGYISDAAGAAQQMADTQLDNLAGDVTLFQSALEGAKITLSDQLTPTLRKFVQLATSGVSSVSKAFQENGLAGAMEELGVFISNGLNMIIEMLPNVIEAGASLLQALLDGIVQNLPLIMDAVIQVTETIVTFIIENLPMLLEAAIQIITTLANGLTEMLPELIPTIVSIILQIVETLIDNVDQLVDAAIEIIFALADGLIASLPTLLEKAPIIISKLVEAVIANAGKLLAAALELVISLASGLIQNIPMILKAGLEILTGLVSAIMGGIDQVMDVGVNLVKGLWDGISSAASWLWDKLTGWLNSVWDGIKSFFGVASPSKEMAWLGKMLVEGLTGGIDDNGNQAVKAAENMANDVLSVMDGLSSDIGADFSSKLNVSTSSRIPTETIDFEKSAISQSAYAAVKSAQNYVSSNSEKPQPVTIIVQLASGLEIARQVVDDINTLQRITGTALI